MMPLLELAPGIRLPDGTAVAACLESLAPPQEVRLVGPAALLE
jgi:hypothetical protein